MSFWDKTKKALDRLRFIWLFRIPAILVYIALVWIIFITGRDFLADDNFNDTLFIYLTGIGLSIAISSAVFTYSQCNTNQQKSLLKIAQLFLYASISLIMALFLSWLSFEIKVQSFYSNNIVQIITYVLFASNFMFFLFAANSFQARLVKLEEHLFFEIKENITKF